jgi:hypothetical protein
MADKPIAVERWGIFEKTFTGPSEGNPFVDVDLKATFNIGHRKVEIAGFYDGDRAYKIRFMPDTKGTWSFTTSSNKSELDGITGEFECVEATPGNHGPVKVKNTFHFVHADGTPFVPFGTTCYGWGFSGEELESMTIQSLKDSPFNKLRMIVLCQKEGKHDLLPFEGSFEEGFDFGRFNPKFFEHLENHILHLMSMHIEADLILFHPYNKKDGLTRLMDPDTEDFWLFAASDNMSKNSTSKHQKIFENRTRELV